MGFRQWRAHESAASDFLISTDKALIWRDLLLHMYPSLRAQVDADRGRVLGIMDFRYVPYALGDACTWLTKLQIVASRHSLPDIEIMLVTLPHRPSSPLQPHIRPYNYASVIDGLLPAFLCCKNIRAIRIFEHKREALHRVLGAMLGRTPSWPSLLSHMRRQLDFITHDQINRFFAERGWIPKLNPPFGFKAETDRFRRRFCEGRVPIIVNIRQSGLSENPAALKRDSPADVWFRFLARAEKVWPTALFVLVGGFSEWERRFARCRNVVIPRLYGLGLGHELTLLLDGTPFIGTSSGFSAAATFSDTPYVITNVEHRAAKFFGISVGVERFPFATARQWLSWEMESDALLAHLFDRLWASLEKIG